MNKQAIYKANKYDFLGNSNAKNFTNSKLNTLFWGTAPGNKTELPKSLRNVPPVSGFITSSTHASLPDRSPKTPSIRITVLLCGIPFVPFSINLFNNPSLTGSIAGFNPCAFIFFSIQSRLRLSARFIIIFSQSIYLLPHFDHEIIKPIAYFNIQINNFVPMPRPTDYHHYNSKSYRY